MQETNKSKWLVLSIMVSTTFMATLDSSIVNVALPTMARGLKVTSGEIAWVVSAYLIAISASILIFGRLGDIKGQSKIFKIGIIIFTTGSALCSLTNSFSFLILARIIQAVGSAGMMANSQGIITRTFPPTERGRALGLNGTFVALGSLVGPALGGLILSFASWKYLFWINVPIGIVIYILSFKLLPSKEQNTANKVDIKGAILFILFVIPLFAALEEVQVAGLQNLLVIVFLAISIISFVLFILAERKHQTPLLQLKIFKNMWFSISLICAFLSFISIFVSIIILPFYLQDILKMSPGGAGLYMTIYPLVMATVAPISGHISDKIGSEILTLIGLIVMSVGLIFMSTLNENPSFVIMGIYIVMMSLGNGLFQSPNTSLIMSTVKKEYLGIGGSVNALVRNLGMAVGIVLSTSILYFCMSSKLGYRVTGYQAGLDSAFIYGMRVVYITAACISLTGAVITGIRLYKRKTAAK